MDSHLHNSPVRQIKNAVPVQDQLPQGQSKEAEPQVRIEKQNLSQGHQVQNPNPPGQRLPEEGRQDQVEVIPQGQQREDQLSQGQSEDQLFQGHTDDLLPPIQSNGAAIDMIESSPQECKQSLLSWRRNRRTPQAELPPTTQKERDGESEQRIQDSREECVEQEYFFPIPKDKGWAWMVVFGCCNVQFLVMGVVKCLGILTVELQEKYDSSTRALTTLLSVMAMLSCSLGCFIVQFVCLGIPKSFGILFVEITERFHSQASETTWVISVNALLAMSLGPFATSLGLRFSNRGVIMVGGVLLSAGFTLSAFAPSLPYLYLFYGVFAGFGIAFCYAPGIITVAQYFEKRRSLANGISIAGSGLGNFVFPIVFRYLLDNWSLQGALIIIGGLLLHVCVSSLLMRPTSFYTRHGLRRTRQVAARPSGVIPQVLIEEVDQIPPKAESHQDLNVLHQKEFGASAARIRRFSRSADYLSSNGRVQPKYPRGGEALMKNPVLRSLYYGGGDVTAASVQSIPDYFGTSAGSQHPESEPRGSLHILDGEEDKLPVTCYRRLVWTMCYLPPSPSGERKPLFDWSLLWNPVFLIYSLSVMFSSMGYASVLLMLPPNAQEIGIEKSRAAILISTMGAADLLGRVAFGWFSDFDLIKKRYGYILAMASSGLVCFFFPLWRSFVGQMVLVSFFGLFGGSYIALIPVLLVESLGLEKLPNAFGLSVMGQGIAMMVAFIVIGLLRDVTGSWNMSFYFSAIMIVIAAALVLLIPMATSWMRKKQVKQVKLDGLLNDYKESLTVEV